MPTIRRLWGLFAGKYFFSDSLSTQSFIEPPASSALDVPRFKPQAELLMLVVEFYASRRPRLEKQEGANLVTRPGVGDVCREASDVTNEWTLSSVKIFTLGWFISRNRFQTRRTRPREGTLCSVAN